MTLTAPYFDDHNDGPEAVQCEWLPSEDGVRLRLAVWPLENATGTVFILPGRTEHIEKYTRVAAGLVSRGFAALAVDWRGQGLADRLHDDSTAGHVEDFADFQRDLAAVIARAQALNLPKPWHMLAHSMGGCIGLRALMGPHPFSSAAFSGPMWGIRMAPLLLPVARVLTTASQKLGFSNAFAPGQAGESYFVSGKFDDNLLTNDPGMWGWMREQVTSRPELAIGGPTLQWLGAALQEMDLLHQMASPRLPALTLLGTDEGIVDAARIKDRMARWPDGTLRQIPQGRHEVLMEPPEKVAPLLDEIAAHYSRSAQPIAA